MTKRPVRHIEVADVANAVNTPAEYYDAFTYNTELAFEVFTDLSPMGVVPDHHRKYVGDLVRYFDYIASSAYNKLTDSAKEILKELYRLLRNTDDVYDGLI